MTETDSGCSSECPVGEILGAVLGTFFGTLLFCAVLALLLVLVYRRRQQRLMTAQRIAGKIIFSSGVLDLRYIHPDDKLLLVR